MKFNNWTFGETHGFWATRTVCHELFSSFFLVYYADFFLNNLAVSTNTNTYGLFQDVPPLTLAYILVLVFLDINPNRSNPWKAQRNDHWVNLRWRPFHCWLSTSVVKTDSNGHQNPQLRTEQLTWPCSRAQTNWDIKAMLWLVDYFLDTINALQSSCLEKGWEMSVYINGSEPRSPVNFKIAFSLFHRLTRR